MDHIFVKMFYISYSVELTDFVKAVKITKGISYS